MPHEVETMAYAREGGVPWHGLGVAVDGAMTSAIALEMANLDWKVSKEPVYGADGNAIPDVYSVRRSSDNKHLGIVGAEYECWNNIEAFGFGDSLVQDGVMSYETAISLRGGTRVVLLGKLQADWRVGDDEYKSYLLIATSHDGSMSVTGTPTSIRVVCGNTLNMSLASAERNQRFISIRHTENMRDRLAVARNLLNITTVQQRNLKEFLERAQDTKVNGDDVLNMARLLIGDPEKAETKRIEAKRNDQTLDFMSDFILPEFERNESSAYALLQAATGWADHALTFKGDSKPESRFFSTLEGKGSVLKANAFQYVNNLVTV